MESSPPDNAGDPSLARDYALAACVMEQYPDTALAAEADSWAGGLVERGTLPAEAYAELARWARSAPQPGSNQDGTRMRLQSCVDFVHSPDFSRRLQKMLRDLQ